MHIEILHLPVWQGPLDIGELLRLTLGVDLLDTGAQLHWPIGDVQGMKGTAYVVQDEAKSRPHLLVEQQHVALQIQDYLRHWYRVKGCLPQADMAYEVGADVRILRLCHYEQAF